MKKVKVPFFTLAIVLFIAGIMLLKEIEVYHQGVWNLYHYMIVSSFYLVFFAALFIHFKNRRQ